VSGRIKKAAWNDECELMEFIRLKKECVRYAARKKHELSGRHAEHLALDV
jgi:hypothetical protein